MEVNYLRHAAFLVLAALAGVPAAADGGDPHAAHKAMMNDKAGVPADAAEIDLRDRTLIDRNGNEVRLVSDVIGDRIVVMNFVYTTCTTICPVLSALFRQVQERLGPQLGDEVVMVSLTVDPARDTPQRLRAYAASHRAAADWRWLTGPKTTVEDVLIGVGAYSVNFEDHPSMVLVGDGRSGEWKRLFGFPSPDRILEIVGDLRNKRAEGG